MHIRIRSNKKRLTLLIGMVMILLLAACNGGSATNGNNANSQTPDNGASANEPPVQEEMTPVKAIEAGEITDISNNQVLVTAYAENDGIPIFEAISFRLTEDTEIVEESGGAVSLDELRIGMRVEAWHTGLVKESYPMQVEAVKLVLLDDSSDELEIAIPRAEAIRIALEAQTEVAGPWVVQDAALDEEQAFWNITLIHAMYRDQPVPLRIHTTSGEITPPVVAENDSFRIYTPYPEEELSPGFTVEGEASVFEGAFSWMLEDGHRILAEGHEQTDHGAPAWGSFSFEVNFEKASQPNMMLILYYSSANDGSMQDELIIPLKVAEDYIQYSTEENS